MVQIKQKQIIGLEDRFNDLPFVDSFTTPQLAITSGGITVVSHGLIGTPQPLLAELVCLTDEIGYVTGEIGYPNFIQASGNNRGIGILMDATDINISFGSNTKVFMLINPGSGSATAVTNAFWELRLTVALLS